MEVVDKKMCRQSSTPSNLIAILNHKLGALVDVVDKGGVKANDHCDLVLGDATQMSFKVSNDSGYFCKKKRRRKEEVTMLKARCRELGTPAGCYQGKQKDETPN